jgi:uncharacterized membrane protein YjjP (DUF1212 family)
MSHDLHTGLEGVDFALKLGAALQRFGAPAHRLEGAMREVVETMGMEGEFFSTPTAIFASLGNAADRRTFLLRIEQSEVDLAKMTELTDIGNLVISGRMHPHQGLEEIDRVLKAPPAYGMFVTLASFGIVSAAASRFFGAGALELLVVFFAGLLVGGLAIASSRTPSLGPVFEPLAALLVSLLATLAPAVVGPVSAPVITLAGLIVLVPGFTLTVAVNELAQRNLISGTARLHGAFTTFLMLAFGVALGASIGVALVGRPVAFAPRPMAPFTEWIAVIVAGITLGILFRAPRRDLIWITLTALVTFAVMRVSSGPLGPELGVFVGALATGVLSNVYARILDRPAAVTRVPAMMLLVPGGLGFLSLSSLMEQDVLKGLQTAFSVAVMAVALVTGLLISNAIVPPGKKL